VIDPFARAFVGCGNENDNSDVGVFLDTLDVIKERAGVNELIMPVHTGRAVHEEGQERGRGATRIDDWTDVRWLLTTDENARRYLRAIGRDVDEPEEMLSFDPASRRLGIGGWDRRAQKAIDAFDRVITYVTDHPAASLNDIADGLGGRRAVILKAIQEAIDKRRLVVKIEGKRHSHYVAGDHRQWLEAEASQ
jgi:hypothetical protein